MADEILTVAAFGAELLNGPQYDRTRALIERSMRSAVDRATGRAPTAVEVAIGPAPVRVDPRVVRH